MKTITFDWSACGIPEAQIQTLLKQTEPEFARIQRAATTGYEDARASLNLCQDKTMLRNVRAMVAEKKRLKPSALLHIGIGGSNLGVIAIQEALLGRVLPKGMQILYADTVDSPSTSRIAAALEARLRRGEKIIIHLVSKSGSTTESIANFALYARLLKRYDKHYQSSIVITSDDDSKLTEYAHTQGYACLSIPKKVGGRYSALSPVGLFPLGLLGIPIDELLAGAAHMRNQCLKSLDNPAARSAVFQYAQDIQGRVISDLFLFSSDLESLGKWYSQMLAESIGKEYDTSGKKVNVGITPTVSIGSTDLHSIGQLFLGGPKDEITTFVHAMKQKPAVSIPKDTALEQLVPHVTGKRVQTIMDAIYGGVMVAFKQHERPYVQVHLPEVSAHVLGQFMQWKMMEIMYLGSLFNVNPYDQPNVEAYKTETKKILAGQ